MPVTRLAGVFVATAAFVIGCSEPAAANRAAAAQVTTAPATPFEFVREKMGGPFRIVIYATDREAAERAGEAAFARIDQLDAILSDYRSDSEIVKLSQRTAAGPMTEPVAVSDDLWRVLARGQAIAEQSGGAFDVTVGPFVRLWRRSRELHELPTRERIEATRPSVGYQHVRLDPHKHTVQLLAPRMRLDVAGLASGYVADQVVAAALAAGAVTALADAGGEISVGDPPPGEDHWTVAIQSLKNPEEMTGQYVKLRRACVTSSGDTRRFVEIDGRRYSHIIDPKTGVGLTRRIGATVVCPDGMTADALDTAVCVLGAERGIELIDKTPGAAGRITTIDGEKVTVYESKRFRDVLVNPK